MAPLIPRAVLFGNPDRFNPALSPEGDRLAYVAPDAGVPNLWVRTVGRTDDRAVTQERGAGIFDYFWSPDGRGLLYLKDHDGDENFRLYRLDLATGGETCLTPFDKVQVQVVMVDPGHPEEILIAMNKRNPRVHDLYRLSLATAELTLAAEPPGNVRFWIPDPLLRVRGVYLARPDAGFDFLVRDDESSPWKTLVSWNREDALTSRPLGFSRDGTSVILLDSRGATTGRLVEMDPETGQTRFLAADDAYDMGSVFGVDALVDRETGRIQAVGYDGTRRVWNVMDPDLDPDFEALGSVDDGDFYIVSRSRDDRVWLVRFEHDDRSACSYTYHREARRAEFLFAMQPALDAYRLAPMEPIRFTARDGLEIPGYIRFPVGVERRGLPMVVLPHGRPGCLGP